MTAMREFDDFYKLREKGHRLDFPLEGSFCEMKMTLDDNRKYIVCCSAAQAILLSLLDENEIMTYQEVSSYFNIEQSELKKHLIPLFLQKGDKESLLLKVPATKSFSNEDKISMNKQFSSKTKYVRINAFQKKESKEEIEKTTEAIMEERKLAIEASIVRVMKSKKQMKHSLLIHEVMSSLGLNLTVRNNFFKIQGNDVKQILEKVINNGYLRRDDDDTNIYHYIS